MSVRVALRQHDFAYVLCIVFVLVIQMLDAWRDDFIGHVTIVFFVAAVGTTNTVSVFCRQNDV